MKTVVTGGTGFIGSHLVKRLLAQGREVIVASDLSHRGIENLAYLGISPNDVELRDADLSDYRQALRAIDGADTVFHLAARVGGLEYLHGAELAELVALQTNLVIDTNVFRACSERKVEKMIYASSCAVYPLTKQFSHDAVLAEDDCQLSGSPFETLGLTFRPDGGYGWAKLLAEIQLGWMNDIEAGIARIFNVYGENEPLGEKAHMVADLISKAIRYPKQQFIVKGDGNQSRDLLYVSDCIDALLRLEDRAANPPQTVNIGSGRRTTIRTVAEEIVRLSGKDIETIYEPGSPVGPLSRTADITRARMLLDWEPKVSLSEGLRRTYSWIEKKLGRDGASNSTW